MRARPLLRAITLAAFLAVPFSAAAEPSAESFVKQKQAELVTLVQQNNPNSGKKIEGIFDDMLDYETLARESLRDHWEARSEEERKEFRGVLKELVQRAYRKNLDKTANYDVKYEGAQKKGDDGVLVRTVARSKTDVREEPIQIDYLVKQVDGQWRVGDIVTEGSSLVINYRRQFTRVIKKDGFSELMRRMKNKLAKG